MTSRRWATLVGTTLLLLMTAISGAEERRKDTVTLDIERQPLGIALNTFAQQSGLQVVFFSEISGGIMSPRLAGTYTPKDALEKMLANTSLNYEFINPRTVAIRAAKSDAAPAVDDAKSAAAQTQMRLTQAERVTPRQSAADVEESAVASAEGIPEILVKGKKSLNADIERTEDAPQPYVVFGSEEIQRSQADNLEEFLRMRLPMNTSNASSGQETGSSATFSGINLRGLGRNQTLILVDGRRVVTLSSSGEPQQSDINGIPLSAVERIEVLPSTAGGIYGGSATGGVINIILRRDFQGLEARANYRNAFDSDVGSMLLEVNGGFNLEEGRTRIMVTASRSESNRLVIGDRDFARRALALQLENNPAAVTGSNTPPLGATVNILSNQIIGGVRQRLTLKPAYGSGALGSTFTHVPLGYRGAASDQGAGLIANAGRYNLEIPSGPNGSERSLLAAPSLESAALNVRREFGPRLNVFADISTNRSQGDSYSGSMPTTVTSMPVNNPFNPFNQPITVRFPSPGLKFPAHSESTTVRATGGVIFQLPFEWTGEMDFGWSRARFTTGLTGSALTVAGSTALRTGQPGSGGRPALNVLQEGNTFPLDFAPYLLPSPNIISGPNDTILKDTTLRFSGPALQLPDGPLIVSALIERRAEKIKDSVITQYSPATSAPIYVLFPHRSQDVDSYYVEARAPLIAAGRQLGWARELEVQLSTRHDVYDTNSVGDSIALTSLDAPFEPLPYFTTRHRSTDYTVGLRYAPTEDIAFRTSFGTGFLPPSVTQIGSNIQDFTFVAPGEPYGLGVDPQRGGNDMQVDQEFRLIEGGNPDLLPEESRSWSAGVVFTPRFAPDLRLSIDYTRIRKVNEIQSLDPQYLLDNEELFPDRITRGPNLSTDPVNQDWAGVIRTFDISIINVANSRVEAFDMQADYTVSLADRGQLHFYAVATWQPHLVNQPLPTAPAVDLVGYSNAPLEWRGNLGLDWDRGPFTLGWNMQYYDSYFVYQATDSAGVAASARLDQGSATIAHQAYHDLIATYRFDTTNSVLGFLLSDSELSVGIQNVFDKIPPILASTSVITGGYSTYGDPRLRRYSVSFRKSFNNRGR